MRISEYICDSLFEQHHHIYQRQLRESHLKSMSNITKIAWQQSISQIKEMQSLSKRSHLSRTHHYNRRTADDVWKARSNTQLINIYECHESAILSQNHQLLLKLHSALCKIDQVTHRLIQEI